MHWRAAGKVDIGGPTYKIRTCHGTMVVKVHDQKREVSTRALKLINRTIINLNFYIRYWVEYGGTQAEWATRPWPLSTFILQFRFEFTILSDQEGRHFCQRVHHCKQWTTWQISSMMKHYCQAIWTNSIETIGHNTLQVQSVLLRKLLRASLLHSW